MWRVSTRRGCAPPSWSALVALLHSRGRRPFSNQRPVDLSATGDRLTCNVEVLQEDGFTVNGVDMRGSVFLLPRIYLHWRPETLDEALISIRSAFGVVNVTRPRIELVVLGTGRKGAYVSGPILSSLKDAIGCSVEVMDTFQAVNTFNVLIQDGRHCAAALLPHGYDWEASLGNGRGKGPLPGPGPGPGSDMPARPRNK